MTLKRWLPAILWLVAIFLVSNQPSTGLPNFGLFDLLVKKAGHFLAYAILAVLVQRAWFLGSASWGWALVLTAVYAITDELHQTFILGRFGSLADVLIDISGALTALLFTHYRLSISRHRLSDTPTTLHPLPLTSHHSSTSVQSTQTVPLDEPTTPAV